MIRCCCMENEDVSTNEIMGFLKKNMVTRDEAIETFATKADVEGFATKEDILESKSEVIEHVDSFAKLHETLDQELAMLRSKYNRLEERLDLVEAKIGV